MNCKPIQPIPNPQPTTTKVPPKEPTVVVVYKKLLKDTENLDRFERQK